MKLQADSNYLLSKEYEVQLRGNDALAPLVLSRISLQAFTVESQADWAQELGWHLGSQLRVLLCLNPFPAQYTT